MRESSIQFWVSTAAALLALLLLAGAVAYARGVADGSKLRLRSSCEIERAQLLKPAWYYTEPREFFQ